MMGHIRDYGLSKWVTGTDIIIVHISYRLPHQEKVDEPFFWKFEKTVFSGPGHHGLLQSS